MVDEVFFRTPNPRNRLLLELMARAGMRVGEVLRLRHKDIEDRKAIIRAPKTGKEAEAAFLPQKVADRLQRCIADKGLDPEDGIFPITCTTARIIVRKAGDLVGMHPWPRPLTPQFSAVQAPRTV